MVTVVWQEKAVDDLEYILRYGEGIFGRRVTERLRAEILRSARLLETNPRLGICLIKAVPGYPEIRQLLATSLFALIYFVDEERDKLHIVTIRDMRRNPSDFYDELGR